MNYGRKAYGAHRKVSAEKQAQFIAESIRTHAAHGTQRDPELYTRNPATLALVRAELARQ